MTIKALQEEIIDEFSMFDDWMQRYEYMIELGKSLPLIEEQYKVNENLITGCQSNVWVHATMKENNVVFTADSDAIITKGIIAILIRVFSNQHPSEIINAETTGIAYECRDFLEPMDILVVLLIMVSYNKESASLKQDSLVGTYSRAEFL